MYQQAGATSRATDSSIACMLLVCTAVIDVAQKGLGRALRPYRKLSCERFSKAITRKQPALPGLPIPGTSSLSSSYIPRQVRSIDVEFAHFRSKGRIITAAAEVCLLAEDGSLLLGSCICPVVHSQAETKWIGGVTPGCYQQAPCLAVVQDQLLKLMKGCLLVGYGLNKDLAALHLEHPDTLKKDLMTCTKFQSGRNGQARKLQDVTREYLGVQIQAGQHSAREDAHAVLQLYLLHVRDDPAFMTYQELVDFELRSLPWKADAHGS